MAGLVKNNTIQYCIIAFLIVAFLVIAGIAFSVNCDILLRFILLNILSIFLPGVAVYQLFNFREKLSKVASISAVYSVGYVLLIVQYFLSELTQRVVSFQLIAIVFTCLSILIIVYSAKEGKLRISYDTGSDEWIGIVAFAFFLGLSIFAYSANYPSPDIIDNCSMPRDIVYWGNNSVALKIAFPPDNLFFLDSSLNYHYFSNIPIAFLSSVYGIDIFTLSFPLYPLTKTFVVVGSALILLEIIGAKKYLKILGLAAFLFITGIESLSIVTFVSHTLLAPFGCDLGLGYGVLFIAGLIAQWNKHCFDWHIFGIVLVFWFMCIGCKEPTAVIFMVVPGVLCIWSLFKKDYSVAFAYGISILLFFYLVSRYCLGLFGAIDEYDATLSRLSLYDIASISSLSYIGDNPLWASLASIVDGNLFVVLLVRLIAMSPAVFFGFIVSVTVFVVLTKRNKMTTREIVLFCALNTAALVGLLLWIMVKAADESEMYFAMAAKQSECAAIIYIFCLLQKADLSFSAIQIKIKAIVEASMVFLVAFGVFCYLFYAYRGGALINAYKGFNNLKGVSYLSQGDNGIEKSTYEGLVWLRDNTELDAIVLSDKAIIGDDPAYYYYGLFSERQQYIEGTNLLPTSKVMQDEILERRDLVMRVYNNDISAIDELASKGIDYIIQTKEITPDFDGKECGLASVFENDSIVVYKL